MRFLCKGRSGNEDAFSSSLTLESSSELLNLGPANCTLPPLRLNVDHIQTEPVFLNDSIDAATPPPPNSAPSPGSHPAIAHRHNEIDHQSFKKIGWTLLN